MEKVKVDAREASPSNSACAPAFVKPASASERLCLVMAMLRPWMLFHPSSSTSTSTSSRVLALLFLLFALAFPIATSLSLSLSASGTRTLLQAQQGCPVSFENLNYTIITSRCKGPKYPPNICCDALKDLACPYADQLNDQSNNCATTMFSYIDLYGKYPPGLFANECRDSKRGLECSASQSQSASATPTPTAAAAPPLHPLLSFLPLLTLFLP